MVFRFKFYNLPFFRWWDGNVDKYSVLIFFPCNLILSQYVQNYRPLPHPHLYYLICLKLLLIYHVANIIDHTKCASTQYKNK